MENKKQVVELWGHTQSKIHHLNFTWTLDNYSFLQNDSRKYFTSPEFPFEAINGITWDLTLYTKGEEERDKDYVSIFIRQLSRFITLLKVSAKFKISVLNVQPMKTITMESEEAENREDRSFCGWKSFIKRALILDKAEGFLPDNKLTILCEVSYLSDVINVNKIIKVPECKLANNLGDLLESKKLSDVTLVVGENEFAAHRAILAARSDVFAAMFDHNMEECTSGRVVISDIDQEVLQELLNFIYTGKAPKLKEMTNHLLAAADKYALKELKAMAEEVLSARLSIETAAETLVLADLHCAEQLKVQAIEFIRSHGKEILKTQGWTDMCYGSVYSALILEVLEALMTLSL